ncbi:unnamed protein product [Rotaria magnacalcarata]
MIFDKEHCEILNKDHIVYSDDDGFYECTLAKNDDNGQLTYRMQILTNDQLAEYYVVTENSNGQISVELCHSDINLVKSKFCSLFHDLTGNFWQNRERFIHTPGYYLYTSSNDSHSSSSSEEQQFAINQINKIPKFYSTERAFFNAEMNSIEQTYTYIDCGSTWQIISPRIPCENEIISSLLSVRKSIVRIGVLYERESAIEMFFGSGLLLTDELILTCAHNFDPIIWSTKKVPYSKIYICCCDPAFESFFSLSNRTQVLTEATIIRRGLERDNLTKYDEVECQMTDLALIRLNKPLTHLQIDEYFDPKLNLLSSTSNHTPMNSGLYLICYNGQLKDSDDLIPYKNVKGFENITIDELNAQHNVNYKSISIGRLIEFCSTNQYATHNCSTLRGSSGCLMLDSKGNFAGIHIGVINSRKGKNSDMFFYKETYNKFIPVYSKLFREFIHETILPNIKNEQLVEKWGFLSSKDVSK